MLTPEEAVAPIRSGMRVFVHGAAATPTPLLDALAARTDLDGVTLYHLHLQGRVAVAEPGFAGRFRCNSLFTGAALRGAVNDGRAGVRRGRPLGLLAARARGGVGLDRASRFPHRAAAGDRRGALMDVMNIERRAGVSPAVPQASRLHAGRRGRRHYGRRDGGATLTCGGFL